MHMLQLVLPSLCPHSFNVVHAAEDFSSAVTAHETEALHRMKFILTAGLWLQVGLQ